MTIDGCDFSFKELAEKNLPNQMQKMHVALQKPISMGIFGNKGSGKVTVLKLLNRKVDVQGSYVLSDVSGLIYIGISRSVVQRLIQHIKGKTHFDASFAYRMAAHNYNHEMTGGDAMEHPEFLQSFNEAKENIKNLDVAFVEINNDLELYLFEVYCSMELDTAQWNTFKTH
jgi:predicted GIY-YIG superfamily endonuclease